MHIPIEPAEGRPVVEVPPPASPPRSPRAIAWARRRRSLTRIWRTYRKSPMGMIGLVMLTFFIAIAVLAPFISDADGLKATRVTREDIAPCTFAETPCPPSLRNPLGTDDRGRSVLGGGDRRGRHRHRPDG